MGIVERGLPGSSIIYVALLCGLGLLSCTSGGGVGDSRQGSREDLSRGQGVIISPAALEELDRRSRVAWRRLPEAKHRCESFDYFPVGGMYTVYCRLVNFGTFQEVETLLGMPVFLKGPHRGGELNVYSTAQFGHYNPQFVRTLADWSIPALRDAAFLEQTRWAYDEYIRPLAQIYYMTYLKLEQEPELYAQEIGRLERAMEREEMAGFYEEYFFFMNPYFVEHREGSFQFFMDRGFDGGVDGNRVKGAVGFWLRRGIDGTADLFAQGLESLLRIYEDEILYYHEF